MFHQYVENESVEPNEELWIFRHEIWQLEDRIRWNQQDVSDILLERIQYLNLSNPTDEEHSDFRQNNARADYLLAENCKLRSKIEQLWFHIDNIKADQDIDGPSLSPVSNDSEEFVVNVLKRSKTFP